MKQCILLLWLIIVPSIHAVDIGIGIRAGIEGFFYSRQLSTAPVTPTYVDNTEYQVIGRCYTTTNFFGSVLLHLRFNPWFTLGSALNLSLNRSINIRNAFSSPNTLIQANNHVFEGELLSQLSLGWWYLGFGASIFITTPLHPESPNAYLREILLQHSKQNWGFAVVLETGLNIGITNTPHTISIGLRSAMNVNAFIHKTVTTAPLSSSLFLGYTYFFS